jgi:hypothetical protein
MFGACYRLVARSTDSPAARALLAVADEALAMGIQIRTLLVQHGSPMQSAGLAGQGTPAGEWRVISDPRLLEAHEQLVLSDSKAWIGDCMRRDPSRRDAYETYCNGSDSRASWAARSFEHMWTAAAPPDHGSVSKVVPAEAFIDASLIAVSESLPSAATLRH